MPVYADQIGKEVVLPRVPKRIVSLVPSQTELLHDLGLESEVVGITKFCIHPDKWFRSKTRIGGTKMLHLDKIRDLQPDLIIANREENVKDQVEALAKEFPVWTSDINTLPDALRMIESIGEITGTGEKAAEISRHISGQFESMQNEVKGQRKKTAYLIWKDPYMTAGGDTFINDMLERAGFDNLFREKSRYPETTVSELQALGCALLILSSEPYPFRQKHVEELSAALPGTKILLVDGEAFSWYGSRLLQSPEAFAQIRSLSLL